MVSIRKEKSVLKRPAVRVFPSPVNNRVASRSEIGKELSRGLGNVRAANLGSGSSWGIGVTSLLLQRPRYRASEWARKLVSSGWIENR